MKRTRKIPLILLSLGSVLAISLPTLTSCADDMSKIKFVKRGDGTYVAEAKKSPDLSLTFENTLQQSFKSSTAFSNAKKQIVNELLYNWYFNLKESDKSPQSFKDNWKTWTKEVNDSYKDEMQKAKDNHGSSWKYYFQNETLDPNGGTEESWKYLQMCSKIRSAFSSLVFANKYLAYSQNPSADENQRVNSPINNFSLELFADSSSWKNIDFYAYSNANYSPINNDLDDIYALIQKEAFKQWTAKEHPISVQMSLWKYADPTGGLESVYDKSRQPSSGSSDSLSEDEESFKTSYELPSFPTYDGSATNANAKFYNLVSKYMNQSANYALDANGVSTIRQNSNVTDDSATSIITSASTAFGSLDVDFAGAVSTLYGLSSSRSQMSENSVHYVNYNADLLNQGSAFNTDILYNFMYRSGDRRLWSGSSISTFGTSLFNNFYNVIDLSKLYEQRGTSSSATSKSTNFHSNLFNIHSTYFGDENAEGGVQLVSSALRLTDAKGNLLPYVLIRDSFGVHLIGINGAVTYKDGAVTQGYLAKPADDTNNNTQPFSQARQNLLLVAQTLQQKLTEIFESGIDENSKIESYFGNNMDDIILAMAKNKTKRANDNQSIIFDDAKVLGAKSSLFYNLIEQGNKYFLYQETISAFDTANNKIYGDKLKKANNNLYNSKTKTNAKNYSNGLATTFFSDRVNGDFNAYTQNKLLESTTYYSACTIGLWLNNGDLANDVWNVTTSLSAFNKDKLDKLQKDYEDTIKAITTNVKAYISETTGYQKYSERLYPEWQKNNTENSVNNAIYMAIQGFWDTEGAPNAIKINAMKKYAPDIVDSIDSFTQIPTLKDANLQKAVASQYLTSKLLTDTTPLSYYAGYNSLTIDNYQSFLTNQYLSKNSKSFSTFTTSSDLVNYWKFIDTINYLVKDNYANLIKKLTADIQYPGEANIVWSIKDNLAVNPNFNVDQTDDSTYFDFNPNYMGYYNLTYLWDATNKASDNLTPSSYTTNSNYYKFASMPGTGKSKMGFVGLITSSSSGNISSKANEYLFTNTYNSKLDANGNHIGGWYKYQSWDSLVKHIESRNTASDLRDIVSDLLKSNSDQEFKKGIYDVVSRKSYQQGDPDISGHQVGEALNWEVVKKRFLGQDEVYKTAGWGLESYYSNNKAKTDNLFVKFGTKTQSAELYNPNNATSSLSHAIADSSDSLDASRIYTIQLNSEDVKSIDALKSAIDDELIAMVTVQYALKESIQTDVVTEVVKTVYGGEKITVYDRRLNDKLGSVWVKDWQITN